MEKMNVIAAILIVVIAVLSVTPYAIAETEGAQLEFRDFYPASLTYEVGEELSIGCIVLNTGTEVIEDATVSLNVLDPNGTYIYSFDYAFAEEGFEPGTKRRIQSRYLWEVDENATAGRYSLEAILRWGSEAIQKSNFFYVPEEPEQDGPGMKITSLYTQRLMYLPGDNVSCSCRIENEMNDTTPFYISMCLFDRNGTMFDSLVSPVLSMSIGKRDAYRFIFPTQIDLEPGIYTVEAILWWDDKATSKTASFGIDY